MHCNLENCNILNYSLAPVNENVKLRLLLGTYLETKFFYPKLIDLFQFKMYNENLIHDYKRKQLKE